MTMKPVTYPVRMVGRARELRSAGWTCEGVADQLQREFGVRPVQSTISRWSDPAVQDRDASTNARRAARARARQSGGRILRMPQTPEFKTARMAALRELGMSDVAIATVMSFDFQATVTAAQVSSALSRVSPRSDWRDRARNLIAERPDIRAAEVARRVGMSVSSVQKFRQAEGL